MPSNLISLKPLLQRSLILLWSLYATIGFAQSTGNFPPPASPPTITAQKALGDITIDGELSESAWQHAKTASDFFRVEPRQGGDFAYATFVKVLYDEKNI